MPSLVLLTAVVLSLLSILFGCHCQSEVHAIRTIAASNLSAITLFARPTGERVFVDSHGRQRIFHGTNAVTKGPPWVPDIRSFSRDISMSKEDFALMQRLGLTVLRLGVMWPGVEPVQRGQYNETYLDIIEDIVTLASEYGVHTLLDMHQDGLAEAFCGEGIPAWAVHSDGKWDPLKFPMPLSKPYAARDSHGFPTRQDCSKFSWESYQGAEATASAYEALWTNVDGLADSWAAMWAHVAARFKGDGRVIGIELVNEPFPGDFYHNPLIMVPWPNPDNGDRTRLQPAYDRAAAAIYAVDPQRLIFYAGATWDDAGVGFSAPPGSFNRSSTSVVAYHYYSPPQLLPPNDTLIQFKNQLAAARRLRSGSMLTETGFYCGQSRFAGPGGVADGADAFLQSYATWEWKSFCRETNATRNGDSQWAAFGSCKTGTGPTWTADNPSCMTDYARTYARAVAGNATSMYYNVISKAFRLEYNVDPAIDAPTEVFASTEFHYPSGVNMSVTPPNAVTVTHTPPNLYHLHTASGVRVGTPITFTLEKRV